MLHTNVKNPYDGANNIFRVSFIPLKSEDNVYIKIRIGSDDEDKRNAEIQSAFSNGTALLIDKGYIVLNHMDKDKKVILSVKLANAKRCPLEVTAYAK